jgi:hypothetical protein
MVTLISTPFMGLCMALLWLQGTLSWPKPVLIVALAALPLAALGAIISALVDLVHLGGLSHVPEHLLRFVVHAVGLLVAVLVLVQTIIFLSRGITRMF